jgi:DNA-binding protein HU-beta
LVLFYIQETSSRKERKIVNKRDLIEEIAQRIDLTNAEAHRYVTTLEQVIAEALKRGEEVQIMGFGKFYVREQKARQGYNPQTKEKMQIPASKVPAFSAGKSLKEAI